MPERMIKLPEELTPEIGIAWATEYALGVPSVLAQMNDGKQVRIHVNADHAHRKNTIEGHPVSTFMPYTVTVKYSMWNPNNSRKYLPPGLYKLEQHKTLTLITDKPAGSRTHGEIVVPKLWTILTLITPSFNDAAGQKFAYFEGGTQVAKYHDTGIEQV
jgi:hypothetical protein